MRFLIDRCAGRRLAEWLRSEDHDVVEARELGPDPGDRELLRTALRDDRILITLDSDFGDLIYRGEQPHRGLLRLPDVPVRQRIELTKQVLDRHGSDLGDGAIVVVRGDRVRVSRHP